MPAGIALAILAVFAQEDYGMCPVTPGERAVADVYVNHEGRRIHFCCPRCRSRFVANPAPYLGRVAQPADPAPKGWGVRAVAFAGKLHPIAVHFPIALLLAAAAAELLNRKRARPGLAAAARFCTAAGGAAAPVAALLGWAAAWHASYEGILATALVLHRWLGTAVGALGAAAWIASERLHRRDTPGRRAAYRALLFAAAVAILAAGHLGGVLVRGPGHLSW
jgi:uncharacterized membrane protein